MPVPEARGPVASFLVLLSMVLAVLVTPEAVHALTFGQVQEAIDDTVVSPLGLPLQDLGTKGAVWQGTLSDHPPIGFALLPERSVLESSILVFGTPSWVSPPVVFHPHYDPFDPRKDPFDTLVFADPPPKPDGPVDLVELSRRIEMLLIGDLLGPGALGSPGYDTFAEYLDALNLNPSPVSTGSAPTSTGVVPEPSTVGLLALGALGVALLRRRSRRVR